jgi:hypothetical protein
VVKIIRPSGHDKTIMISRDGLKNGEVLKSPSLRNKSDGEVLNARMQRRAATGVNYYVEHNLCIYVPVLAVHLLLST